MNIMQIIPGSGGSFYCGNCLRDSKYFQATKKLGHEVTKIPMYLPLFADEHDITDVPVFYGAVSLYLKQQYPWFRKAPAWIDRLLNSKPMLKLAASMAGSTRAEGLEDMTISMLLGEDGKQKEELEKMVEWIENHYKPDVIHISNALLLGLAHRLKERLHIPVVCSLQDEDVWVDPMHPEFRARVWNLMHEKARDIDAFISVSDYFAGVMAKNMNIPLDKITTIHLGVSPEDYQVKIPSQKDRNIGYISRQCYENGLDILVDAFKLLKKDHAFHDVKLIVTGGFTGDDKKYLKQIKRGINSSKLTHDVIFKSEFEGEAITDFFKEVSLISVPVRKGEAFGIYLAESLASGVPIVQPSLGAFPEIVELSEGGYIYEPNTPEALVEALKKALSDPEEMDRKSKKGRESIEKYFNIQHQASRMIDVYKKLPGIV